MSVHKQLGNVTKATSIVFKVYDSNPETSCCEATVLTTTCNQQLLSKSHLSSRMLRTSQAHAFSLKHYFFKDVRTNSLTHSRACLGMHVHLKSAQVGFICTCVLHRALYLYVEMFYIVTFVAKMFGKY